MGEIYLSQALNSTPEIVGQRTIISEDEYQTKQSGSTDPIISGNFFYAIFAISLLILAGWAIWQYLKKPTLRAPVAVVPTKKNSQR